LFGQTCFASIVGEPEETFGDGPVLQIVEGHTQVSVAFIIIIP